ncbi:MAG: hypothetical protein QE271_05555 [Bacteriovoracaceae bacterium]|nr:hypothetical protein [Bacteriovoracaceae bacterium]
MPSSFLNLFVRILFYSSWMISTLASSYATSTLGLSALPKKSDGVGKQYVSGELGIDLSPDSGIGFGGRYSNQFDENSLFDFGLSAGSGERDVNLIFGGTWELFPDYGNQPAFNVKGFYEISRMSKENYNILGISPIFSKGVQAYQMEVYPFIGLPFRYIVGDKNSKGGRFSDALTLGTIIPFKEKWHNLIFNFEAQFNLKRSFTGFVLGLSKDF